MAQRPDLRPLMPPAVAIAAIFLVWEVAARLAGSPDTTPPPSAVALAMVRDAGFLAWHAGFTLLEATLGLAIALVAAFFVAGAFARSPLANAAFMPVVLLAQTVPTLAIAPLLAQAIGEGAFANIAVTAYLCWFPAIIAFTHGFLNVDPDRLTLFRIHNASAQQIWRRLRLPGASASIVSGVRTSAGLAVISAIVSEYGTLVGGIGATIVRHVRGMEVLPADRLFALVVVSALLGLAFTWAAHLLARAATRRWSPES
jgi:ABC-type nitrate/sulfonate/bicarbonate transport system permease component